MHQTLVTSTWDLAGRRTRLTYPGSGLYVDYDYLTTGEMTKARENGATSGVGVLATFAYDNIGRRSSLTRGNGTVTARSENPTDMPTQAPNGIPARQAASDLPVYAISGKVAGVRLRGVAHAG